MKEENNISYDLAEEYARYCVTLDRLGHPILRIKDYIMLNNKKK